MNDIDHSICSGRTLLPAALTDLLIVTSGHGEDDKYRTQEAGGHRGLWRFITSLGFLYKVAKEFWFEEVNCFPP